MAGRLSAGRPGPGCGARRSLDVPGSTSANGILKTRRLILVTRTDSLFAIIGLESVVESLQAHAQDLGSFALDVAAVGKRGHRDATFDLLQPRADTNGDGRAVVGLGRCIRDGDTEI